MNPGILEKLCVQLLKVLGSGNFPSLVCNLSSSSSVRSSAESCSLLCFIAAAFWQKSSNSALRFPFPPSLNCIPLANNFSIHQPLISRNLHCMSFFHLRPPYLILCNARSLDLVHQFRHQISKMRELENGLLSLQAKFLLFEAACRRGLWFNTMSNKQFVSINNPITVIQLFALSTFRSNHNNVSR